MGTTILRVLSSLGYGNCHSRTLSYHLRNMATAVLQDFLSSQGYGSCYFARLLIMSTIWWPPFCRTFHPHLCDMATAISLNFLSSPQYGDCHFAWLFIIISVMWQLPFHYTSYHLCDMVTPILQDFLSSLEWWLQTHCDFAIHISQHLPFMRNTEKCRTMENSISRV